MPTNIKMREKPNSAFISEGRNHSYPFVTVFVLSPIKSVSSISFFQGHMINKEPRMNPVSRDIVTSLYLENNQLRICEKTINPKPHPSAKGIRIFAS